MTTAAAAPASTVSVPDLIPLSDASLPALPASIDPPRYDRARLRSGVVHLGVGNFHRAHQARYLDRLARVGLADGWGITGVGLHSPEIGEVLRAQDGLYLLVEHGSDGPEPHVVGAIRNHLVGAQRPGAVLDALSDPRTRIVTLTITANGYFVTPTGEFAADDPAVLADLRTPDRPDTASGYLVEALDRRRRAGTPPFTVLSCDNIPSNGAAARTMVVSFAELRDPALARWISDHVAFPNSMVDRITPEIDPADRPEIGKSFGVLDRWPVISEQFSQWVIQDEFCNGRPPLEEVGVQFVSDVAPYELTKKRLLNASHCALGYLGYLTGYRTTAEVMADPVYTAFVRGLMDEVVPLLPRIDELPLKPYQATILERLGNPAIADRLTRLCRRGSTKMPSYLLPSIEESIAAGRPHPLMTLAVAGWFRYLTAEDYDGRPIEIEGPLNVEFVERARQRGADPAPLLQVRDVFGSLADAPAFVRDLHVASEALRAGPRETVETWLSIRGGGR